jgi:hypothetical protein
VHGRVRGVAREHLGAEAAGGRRVAAHVVRRRQRERRFAVRGHGLEQPAQQPQRRAQAVARRLAVRERRRLERLAPQVLHVLAHQLHDKVRVGGAEHERGVGGAVGAGEGLGGRRRLGRVRRPVALQPRRLPQQHQRAPHVAVLTPRQRRLQERELGLGLVVAAVLDEHAQEHQVEN